MSKYRVLLTDYAWPELDLERSMLAEVDAELIVAESTDADHLAALAVDCDAIVTCWAEVPESVIAATTRCQIVSRLGIGLDNIDVAACTRREIPVTNVPGYCSREVAEHTIALAFALARNISRFHQQSKNGRYDLAAAPTMRRMEGRTFGIVGMGATGSATAQLATALGMRVIASSRSEPPTTGVTFVERAALWAESDFVSLHLPLTNDTSRLIDSNVLSAMKPTAFLINTARGGLIDHAALTDAIIAGEIAGAALDVQDPEPPDLATPPYNDERVIVTPHAAFTSLESLLELRTRAIQQVIAILRGESAPDVVNRSDLTDS